MVCKEDVVTWFRGLRSYQRIDVMCSLLNLCLPFELRFLGTCLEDLGKRDFHDLRKTENGANNITEINSPDFQCIKEKRVRTKLALYIALLHSCNYTCANGLYKILANLEDINALLKSSVVSNNDDETLEELLVIYILALNHPAFSFEQKLNLGNIFTTLQEEENKRCAVKRTRPMTGSTGLESINDKSPLQQQPYQACASPEQQQPPVHAVTNASHCPPMTPAALTGDPVLNLHDQLSAVGYLRLNYTTPQPLMTPWPPGMVLPSTEPQSSPSPLVSRTSSPCQSNSPSRAGSPGRPKPLQGGPGSFQRPPPRPESGDPLRDTIGKEMPTYQTSLQNFTVDQLRRMSDDELKDLGLTYGAIHQLRSIVTKLQNTNGIALDRGQKKPADLINTDPSNEVLMRRYNNSIEGTNINPGVMYTTVPPPPHVLCTANSPCYTCVVGVTRAPHNNKCPQPHQHQPFIDQMRALRLDSETNLPSNSSASDTASDHSPPDTPSLSNTSDRGPPPKDMGSGEMWNSVGSNEEQQRIGEGNEERRVGPQSHPPHGRARGLGRSSRSNAPGIQTLPRGRGLNPTHRRREIQSSNAVNGGPEDRKVFGANETGAPFAYSTTPGPYIPQTHFIRAAAYPTFPPGSFVRHSFGFPNSEVFIGYGPPTQPFLQTAPGPGPGPGPAPLPYSTMVPPPNKISCYNCGSQNHLPNDCPESTIEEVTKQGQYRIDYTPYPKPGECSSSTQDK